MRILAWHVHGSWMTSFVRGTHEYLVPVVPDRGPDGHGRARTYRWPPNAIEVAPEDLASERIDLVVVQRPRDIELCDAWLGGAASGTTCRSSGSSTTRRKAASTRWSTLPCTSTATFASCT